jgi:hypothetical protein
MTTLPVVIAQRLQGFSSAWSYQPGTLMNTSRPSVRAGSVGMWTTDQEDKTGRQWPGRRRAGRFVQFGRTAFFPPGSGPTDLHFGKN